MTQRDNQSMFLSLAVQPEDVTCIVLRGGKRALSQFAAAYQSDMEVESPAGPLRTVRTKSNLSPLLEPHHGEPLIIHFSKGGTAFLDHNDDALFLIIPSSSSNALRSAICVSEEYEKALQEAEFLRRLGPSAAANRKFSEILGQAVKA